jgi:hypothetical protein
MSNGCAQHASVHGREYSQPPGPTTPPAQRGSWFPTLTPRTASPRWAPQGTHSAACSPAQLLRHRVPQTCGPGNMAKRSIHTVQYVRSDDNQSEHACGRGCHLHSTGTHLIHELVVDLHTAQQVRQRGGKGSRSKVGRAPRTYSARTVAPAARVGPAAGGSLEGLRTATACYWPAPDRLPQSSAECWPWPA